MGCFDVALCLIPPVLGNGIDYVSEEHFRLALGGTTDCVDRVVSYATPLRIASAVAESVRSAPEFSHQLIALVGGGDVRQTLATLLHDLTRCEGDDSTVPLQCMFFASDEASVACKIIGREEMRSVGELMREMGHIVLIALRYKRRVVRLVIAEQLSTTLIASMLGCAWCGLWLVLGGHMGIERSASMLREALAVRDAVKKFCQPLDNTALEIEDVEALLQARAASDAEGQCLSAWWRRCLDGAATTSARRPRVGERAAQRVGGADQQEVVAGREGFFSGQPEETVSGATARIAALESRLAEKDRELRVQRHCVDTRQRETNNPIEESLLKYDTGPQEMRDANSSHKKENTIENLRRELLKAQVAIRDMQQRWDALREENLQNVVEFHQKEKDWQAELKREEEEREVVAEECQRLRSVVSSQGSGMCVVKEAIEAAQALREKELDDLLNKIRAISSANTFASHRRVSPQPVVRPDLPNRPRMLSPASAPKDSFLS